MQSGSGCCLRRSGELASLLLLRERGTKGFRSGVYRVEVVKLDNTGKEQIPARYNVDSELGLEIKMEEHMDTIQIDL